MLGPLILLGQGTTPKWAALDVNGIDVLPHVPLDVAPITWSDQAGDGVGTMQFVVEDRADWASRLPLVRGADVTLRAFGLGQLLFGGTLLTVRYTRGVRGRFAECTVVDHDWWLDHRVVPRFVSQVDLPGKRVRRITSDRRIVMALLEQRVPVLLSDPAYIRSTNTDMPLVKVAGVTAREALERIADAAQHAGSPYPRRFYAGHDRHLHWFQTNEGEAAPYHVGVDIDVEDLEVERDKGDIVHHVYIRGKNAKGSGWVYNTGSDFAVGAVSAFLDRPNSDSVPERNRFGRAYLNRQQEVVSGSFSTLGTSGWRSGQVLTITDALLGLSSATFIIDTVNGELRPGHAVHHIEFGAPKRRLLRDLRRRDLL